MGTTVVAMKANWGPLPLGVQPLTQPAVGAVAALPVPTAATAAPTARPPGLWQAGAIAPASHMGDGKGEEQGEGLSCDSASIGSGQPPQGRLLNVSEQQMAFIECFKDELFRNRPLLLSQLNNLYKMRSGEDLPYKLTGYQKLRDFLLDVPGLALTGRGNRMQVRLEDAAKLEAFQNSIRQAQADANGSSGGSVHTPSFRLPEPLPQILLQQLYELFLACEGNEIPLRSFVNVWNNHYPSEQLAFRALGFRDVRGLLSQVSFIEKVGDKSDCRYVLRHSDGPPPLATRRVSTHDELPSLVRPLQPARQWLEAQAAATDSGMVAPPLHGVWPAQSPVCWPFTAGPVAAESEIEVMGQDASEWPPLAPGNPAQPGQVHAWPRTGSESTIVALRDALERHRIGRGGGLRAAGGECATPAATGRDSFEPPVSGLAMPTTGTLSHDSAFSSSGMGMHGQRTPIGSLAAQGWNGGLATPDSYAGLRPATLEVLGCTLATPDNSYAGQRPATSEALGCAPGLGSWRGSGPPSHASSIGLGSTGMPWDQGLGSTSGRSAQGMGSFSGLARDQNLGAQLSAHVLGSLNGRGGCQERSNSGCGTPCSPAAAIFQDVRRMPQPATAAFMDPRPMAVEPPGMMRGDPEPTELPHEEMPTVEESLARVRDPARRLPRAKKSASFYVSSPGAFSSETRDACIHQGKFDMGSVLQMQLPRDTPCLVCDISGGQVMVTNVECEELFEDSSDTHGQLVQSYIFDLIHPNDRDKLSTCFTYLMVSERTEMDPQEIRIITRAGRVRAVRTQGMQLIGMWWQLEFWRLGSEE